MKRKLTLIELIITVLVLGLLTALALPQFTGVKANADVASFKNDIDVLHKAVDEMYVREDKLPLGDKVTVTDPEMLDVIYASGDSGDHLYKIDLNQSKKYHQALKTKVTTEDYFLYSMETGKIFYTNGQIDGDGKTLYTYEFIGLSGLKLGAVPLVNGMSVPVTEPLQTIEGQVPLNTEVAISVNGTPAAVTYETVTFDGPMNIMAGVKTKKFAAEVLLSNGSNVITIKADNAITNFSINLGESTGGGVIPEVPVIKPVAVISMTPEQGLTTATNITWGYENSTAAEGRTITNVEWEGKESIYPIEGSHTVRLRVQDSTGVWSDWVEKSFVVFGADGVNSIAAGFYHTLILKEDGTLWATGKNDYGQLGTGDTTDRSTFIQVQSGVKSVVAGYYHTLIIKEDGTLWVTGRNDYGQLGSGNTTNRSTFIQVQSGVKSVSAGYDCTFIIKEDGTLWATGLNSSGQLGTGDNTNRSAFTQVQSGVKSVSAGQFHTLILKDDGTLWATGYNYYGQLGTGDTTDRSTFVQVQSGVKSVAAGHYHTLIIKEDSTLWAAGYNTYGQLGTGNTTNRSTFIQVQSGVKSVVAGSAHTFIIKDDGTLWATGYNHRSQLGTGNTTQRTTFTQVQSGVKSVSAGNFHTLILKDDGTLWATGYNYYGQLGTGNATNRSTFIQVQSGVKSVAAGGDHTLVLKEDGTLWATGNNGYGQLGTGDRTNRSTYTQIEF